MKAIEMRRWRVSIENAAYQVITPTVELPVLPLLALFLALLVMAFNLCHEWQ